ncbi:type II toxin-antitoxin system Phd/YefM family antitoxin [Polycladidibacter hongkongensis]|uniref:type II toxin-antitoxin system Phd/YefM family antitoxin n=1 Tax=Polycladidibacter hongkongensis TaxID=1647556 RepID=UPI000B33F3F0|nr:type II toxin-antitoxin system Phd/YefM family antitoxin [Pseudovibrio hongkongensis]
MRTHTISSFRTNLAQVLDEAQREPVLICRRARPTHVLVSSEDMNRICEAMERLEADSRDYELLRLKSVMAEYERIMNE